MRPPPRAMKCIGSCMEGLSTRRIRAGRTRVLTGGCDRDLRLWDVSRGLKSASSGKQVVDVVHDLAWSPDGATVTLALHSLSGGSTLRPWSQPDSLVKRAWTSPLAISFLATNAERISVAPNGKTSPRAA